MSDPRLTLKLGDLAAETLRGIEPAPRYAETVAMTCRQPSAPLRTGPSDEAEQADQLLFGESFDVLARDGEHAFGRARRDGYVGWVPARALAPAAAESTHWVSALRSYAFAAPDIKSPARALLSLNALVAQTGREGRFLQVEGAGWIVAEHLSPIGEALTDPAGIAERFLHAPYLWGGRESLGLDCSGMVQQALYACGLSCPRDTDMQAAALGRAVEGTALERGDLVFWRGHVGMMLDAIRLIHANAHHMRVAIEPLDEARARIGAAGFEVTGFRRLALP